MLVRANMSGGGGTSAISIKGSFPNNYIVNVGFKPKKLIVSLQFATQGFMTCIYDESVSTTTYTRQYMWQSTYYTDTQPLEEPTASITGLSAVGTGSASQGFKFTNKTPNTSTDISYIAVG